MTDLPIIKQLVGSVTDPVLIISPRSNKVISDNEMVKIYEVIETVLQKIASKIGAGFTITVASSIDFDGYDTIDTLSDEQKDEAEVELWRL